MKSTVMCIMLCIIIIATCSFATDMKGPEILVIDIRNNDELRTRPPVKFSHEIHARGGITCRSCHRTGNSPCIILPLNQDKNIYTQTKRDMYHTGCITCHKQVVGNGMNAPLFCGECHKHN